MSRLILPLLFFLILLGCDDPMVLDKSKALNMLSECPDEYKLTKIMPLKTKYIDFRTGKTKELQKGYESLAEQGLITLTKQGSLYHVTFTDKAKQLVLVSPKEVVKYNPNLVTAAFMGSSDRYVITSKRKVVEVLEIQETPQLNVAEAATELEIIEKTPFFFLEEAGKAKSMRKYFMFRKTTDGWKYCKP